MIGGGVAIVICILLTSSLLLNLYYRNVSVTLF